MSTYDTGPRFEVPNTVICTRAGCVHNVMPAGGRGHQCQDAKGHPLLSDARPMVSDEEYAERQGVKRQISRGLL